MLAESGWLKLLLLPIGILLAIGWRLCVSEERRPRASPIAGAMAGTMLAAGTTLYWRLPATFCLPFARAIPGEATLNARYAARKSLDVDLSLAIMLLGLLAGGGLGAVVFALRTASHESAPRPE